MKVLVACEYSGTVRDAFKKKGHDAWSCDILETDSPGNHLKGDVANYLNDGWDLLIGHPPCTHLAVSGARHFKEKIKSGKQQKAIEFFMMLINAPIKKICVENPISIMSTKYRKPDQIIQPYYFGDPVKKSTCLWLKNLPKLVYHKENNLFGKRTIVEPEMIELKSKKSGKKIRFSKWEYKNSFNKKDRGKLRSKTFQGIADAMADQWG